MSDRTIEKYLLATDGINQFGRSPASLDPATVPLDGRSVSDLVQFMYAIAGQIRYYNGDNKKQGDWRAFFNLLTPGGVALSDDEIAYLKAASKDWPPHLALLMAFLEQYSFAQADLNSLTAKRLRFYYEEVLQLVRSQPVPDQVHVIFTPTRNAKPTELKTGTLLDAGITETGKPIQYGLDTDIVVTSSMVSSLMSSFADHNLGGKQMIMKADEAILVEDQTGAWRPFGTTQLTLAPESRQMQAAQLGFAVSSPVLLLAEGERRIRINVHLLSEPGSRPAGLPMTSLVDIDLTGPEGWIVPGTVTDVRLMPDDPGSLSDSEENPYTLSTDISIAQDADAIVQHDPDIHETSLDTEWPVWRLRVKPEAFLLELLAEFVVKSVEIEVQVEALSELILQNDQAVQPPGGSVLPFGNRPFIGSNFYIGNGEIFSKNLTDLKIHLNWKDPPEDIETHYDGYGNPNIDPEDFQTDVDLLAGKVWRSIAVNRSIFNTTDITGTNTVSIPTDELLAAVGEAVYKKNIGLQPFTRFENSTKQGFIRCVLTGPTAADLGNLPTEAPFEAFGHKTFPSAYTQQVIDLALENPATIPKQPYTPELDSIHLDYTARHTITLSATQDDDAFYQLDVFGAARVERQDIALLVPQHPGTGGLYIGFENSPPPMIASLLFQAVEGSAPGEDLLSVEDISWSYLAGNTWHTIARDDIFEDATDGFQKPGLVRILIGSDASREHTLMPTNLLWLRAMVNRPEGAASLLDIRTQAARATLTIAPEDTGEYQEHLSGPLKEESVTGLVRNVPAIKQVEQPYPGFGGRPLESDSAYFRRNHERLRHRGRVVTVWDYERILLERYPDVFKVKCLPHTDLENNLSPGSVKLVIVPDWRQRPAGNPLQPKANLANLREMTRIVQTGAGQFSEVEVTNPSYETLLVDSKVSFHDGFDPGFHAALLTEELQRFLSPWAFDEGKDIVFGGKLHSSEILAFMEGREYVDYIADFSVYHRYKGPKPSGVSDMQIGVDFFIGDTPEPSIGEGSVGKTIGSDFVIGVPVEMAIATQPDAIIVSNDTHRIHALQASDNVCEGSQSIGIGQMIIGLDFIPVS